MSEWIISDGKACYDSNIAGYTLVQPSVMTVDNLYSIVINVEMTQGKLLFPTIEGSHEITESGTYQFIGKATYTDIVVLPLALGGGVFDGCIEIIELLEIPYYSILDCEGNAVFTLNDSTGVTASNGYIQYQIDWSGLSDGIYYLKFSDSGLDYITDCFHVKLNHECTKQITWYCNENAWEFNYSDLNFIQSLRIKLSFWKPNYRATEKEVYDYSDGESEITYVSKAKFQTINTEDLPEYIHDALQLALDSDHFFIDGKKYVFVDEEYSPEWRKRSSLAPVEFQVKEAKNLKNVNCG